ncbi:hypothetical protein [Tardiphaga robiniae]|uniref:hypothetical protein n=1 Tax=Tardiphaga robiniae TaxID=943830 RepID=UPI001585F16A|nr:hypothetical protein [Tardiphaga robiniae]NUU41563.1 hypothetical protein [Tardiphaga robiniae]
MRKWPLNFPAYWVVENAKVEDFFAKLIWLIVPLQYVLLTRIAGGLNSDDYMVAALLSLSSIVLLLIAGSATAGIVIVIIKRARGNYQQVARMWMVTLLICWAGANVLYAISIFYGERLEWDGDIVGEFLRDWMGHRLKIPWSLGPLPGPNWPTFLSYVTFAYLAVAICFLARILHRRFSPSDRESPPLPEPDLVWPGVVVAGVMMLIMVVATKPHARSAECKFGCPLATQELAT